MNPNALKSELKCSDFRTYIKPRKVDHVNTIFFLHLTFEPKILEQWYLNKIFVSKNVI